MPTGSEPSLIYVDSSVALATLFREPRQPPIEFWSRQLVASKLLFYEVWNRLHARDRADLAGEAEGLLARLHVIDLTPEALGRAREPLPLPVRTLDALHLATMDFLRRRGVRLALASFDRRMTEASEAMGFPLLPSDQLVAPDR